MHPMCIRSGPLERRRELKRRGHNAGFGRNQFGMKWVVNWVKVMLRHKHANPGQPMNKFLLRFGAKVSGILSGFDRLRFRGSNRSLCHASGILAFLCWAKILLKDFGDYAEGSTTTLCTAIEKRAVELDTPTIYVPSPADDKEAIALAAAQKHQRTAGLIAVL